MDNVEPTMFVSTIAMIMTINDASSPIIDPIRQTSPEAIDLAISIISAARFGALAVFEPTTKLPLVSRVAVATDQMNTPILLVSALSLHTKALLENKHCSLLLGEPGKGDPLAHPRITLQCEASFLDPNEGETKNVRERFLSSNPKSRMYIDFADFSFVRLMIGSAFLIGGFGQAFQLTGAQLRRPMG